MNDVLELFFTSRRDAETQSSFFSGLFSASLRLCARTEKNFLIITYSPSHGEFGSDAPEYG